MGARTAVPYVGAPTGRILPIWQTFIPKPEHAPAGTRGTVPGCINMYYKYLNLARYGVYGTSIAVLGIKNGF
eukprot:SAG31_NODE_1066_length_10091_cov_5.779323_2_plen_72_part_00